MTSVSEQEAVDALFVARIRRVACQASAAVHDNSSKHNAKVGQPQWTAHV